MSAVQGVQVLLHHLWVYCKDQLLKDVWSLIVWKALHLPWDMSYRDVDLLSSLLRRRVLAVLHWSCLVCWNTYSTYNVSAVCFEGLNFCWYLLLTVTLAAFRSNYSKRYYFLCFFVLATFARVIAREGMAGTMKEWLKFFYVLSLLLSDLHNTALAMCLCGCNSGCSKELLHFESVRGVSKWHSLLLENMAKFYCGQHTVCSQSMTAIRGHPCDSDVGITLVSRPLQPRAVAKY